MERLTLGFFDEILVCTESPSVYQRYLLAAQANNNIIFVCDDDVLVNYQVLFSKYNGRITNTMTKEFLPRYEEMGCTLVGWGCFFPKEMLNVFDKYITKYGEDDPHLLREADRIFSYMNKPFNTIIQPHEDLKRASDDTAMWKEPNHFPSAYAAIEKCKLL